MIGSGILDVAIGVIFIYLFLSLIGTAITEFVSGIAKLRAKNLEEGIRSILNDPDGDGLTRKFYEHPLIKGLIQNKRKPSYIPTRAFTRALMDTIAPPVAGAGPPTLAQIRNSVSAIQNEDLKKLLLINIDSAGNSIAAVRENIEKWFDEGMERISGWYKRKSQVIIYVFAALITLGLNVDTIHVAATLYHDATLRSGLVAAAEGIAKQPLGHGQDDTKKKIQEINAELERLKWPLGWSAFSQAEDVGLREALKSIWKELPGTAPGWLSKLCGWVITLFAISLGAPFWFDMLSKFINIRAAGRKPERKAVEAQKTPSQSVAAQP